MSTHTYIYTYTYTHTYTYTGTRSGEKLVCWRREFDEHTHIHIHIHTHTLTPAPEVVRNSCVGAANSISTHPLLASNTL